MAGKKKERRNGKQSSFVRPAIKDDCGFIRKLSSEVFSIFGDYSDIIPQWFSNPDVMTVICVNSGHPVGFSMLFAPSGEILAVAVTPRYQRSGIGSALLKHIEGLAGQFGLSKLSLHTAKENHIAQLFFQKAGFEASATQEDYYPKGQTALIMSRGI